MIDVCLLLEGTYPYVAGGVSTWVHQLISSIKDLRFGILFIAPYSDPTRTLKYEVPNHVLYLKEIYLHDYNLELRPKRKPTSQDYELIKKFYENVQKEDFKLFANFVRLFQGENSCFGIQNLFNSEQTWDLLTYFYERYAGDISFIDYFWTWRGTHLPLMQMLTAEIPRAKIYHAVSTGYAGLIGAIAKQFNQGKFFLTEHGLYTHERMLEISQASWIYEQKKRDFKAEKGFSFFKQWWITIFDTLSRLAYDSADNIYTLFEGNKRRQILQGAQADKITVIPNGIDVIAFEKIERSKKTHPQIGLIGRVVTIKDIKTYIQAARIVLQKLPTASFYIIGPTDEEQEYFEECKMMVEALHMENNIIFTGRVDPKTYYAFLDLVVLTSISEAQPYVILEANAVGIPVVASDVGACREMLEGSSSLDRTLGVSGKITEVSNPDDTAKAIVEIMTNETLYRHMSQTGKQRVKQYYDDRDLISKYINIYEKNL